MKKTLLLFALVILFACLTSTKAQYYNFTHTTSTYVPLSGGTVISVPYWDDFSVSMIPIPFHVNYYGTQFDTIFVQAGFYGFIYDGVGSFGDYEIASYEYASLIDNTNNTALISYAIMGTAPNRILVIETSNAAFENDMTELDYTNLQTWFYESSGVIEMHYGPNSIQNPSSWDIPGSSGPAIILAQTASLFYALSGPAANPVATTTFVSYTVTGAPPDGMVYVFTPTSSGISTLGSNKSFRVFPNPSHGQITINTSSIAPGSKLNIYNNIGQSVYNGEINSAIEKLNLELHEGLYIVVVENNGQRLVEKLIVD